MKTPLLSRRQFLLRLPALGLTVNVGGFATLAFAQGYPVGAVGTDFDPGKDIYNFVEQRNGTADDRAYAFDVVVQLMNMTGSASWQSMSADARIQQIQQLGNGRIAPKDRPANFAQLSKSLFMAGGATIGVGVAVALMTRNTAILARALSTASTKLPVALKTADTALEAGVGVYGGYQLLKDTAAAFNSTGASKVRSASGAAQGSGGFDLNEQFPGLKVLINKDFSLASAPLDGAAKDMVGWVDQNGKNIFRSEADLAAFMDVYVDKIAEVQSASVERLIEAHRKMASENAANARENALKERDMAALFQSINNVVGLAIDRFAAPTEAYVLKTVIGAGFQYALSGMTPMGWAAVGINVGTAVFSRNKSGGFEKAVMKMLKHIVKQLDTIIEGISEIQKSQIEIFRQINNLLRKIELLEINLSTEFEDIRSKLDVIYSQGRAQARQEIAAEFMGLHLELEDVYRIRLGQPMERLQKMRNLALQKTSHPALTAFSPGVVTSGMIVDLVLSGQKRPIVPVSLYDSIGLLTAFASYDVKQNAGQCTVKIDNPVEFYGVASTLINWMILLDIDLVTRRYFLEQLRTRALENNATIISMCEKPKLERLIQQYATAANEFLRSCREITQREVADSIEHGALGKQILLTPNRIPELGGVKDSSMKPLGLDTFYNNNNDLVLFNLAKELGVVAELRTVSSRPIERSRVYDSGEKELFEEEQGIRNPDQYFPGWNKGTEIARKNNVLVFKSVIINAEMGAALTFDVPYDVSLHMETFGYYFGECRSFGHDGNRTKCSRYYRNVLSATGKLQTPDKWKEPIEKAMRQAGYDVKTAFPKLATLQTPVELVSFLVGEWAALKKMKIFKNVKTQLSAPNFASMDGAGISLAAISKLNEVVSNKDDVIPFELDYIRDAFIRADFMNTLLSSAYFDNSRGAEKDEYARMLADFADNKDAAYLQLLRPDGTYGPKMDPKQLVDFVTILLSKQAQDTIMRCRSKAAVVHADSREPFSALTLAKLDGALNHLT
jgi:hypothetical protein